MGELLKKKTTYIMQTVLTRTVLKLHTFSSSFFVISAMGVHSTRMVSQEQALKGRSKAMSWTSNKDAKHFVNANRLLPPFPENTEKAMFGMGCFWGVERKFWTQSGVYSTSVGYSAGNTENPTYQEVCGGMTNHNEVVQVVYEPEKTSYDQLLKVFWENHNPTQGMRQGNDVGTQYRSGIYYYNDEQKQKALDSKDRYEKELKKAGITGITTEIKLASPFYYAEEYHQQYLAKNPGGYCGMGGTGVSCPVGINKS